MAPDDSGPTQNVPGSNAAAVAAGGRSEVLFGQALQPKKQNANAFGVLYSEQVESSLVGGNGR